MKERERLIVGGLVVLFLASWLGFPFHQSPRFAGSLWGGVLGVLGAALMLVPLAYLIVKRNKQLKQRVTRHIPMRVLLAWHIYAGVLGPILIIAHSGHKYESALGIVLVGMTLVVVVSGFVGRYLMNHFSQEIREKKAILATLETSFQQAASELAQRPQQVAMLQPYSGFFGRLVGSLLVRETSPSTMTSPGELLRLCESIADVEYSIKTHEQFKQWFRRWLKFHIVISVVLYVLMALHIWGAIHFGVRWFQ